MTAPVSLADTRAEQRMQRLVAAQAEPRDPEPARAFLQNQRDDAAARDDFDRADLLHALLQRPTQQKQVEA